MGYGCADTDGRLQKNAGGIAIEIRNRIRQGI